MLNLNQEEVAFLDEPDNWDQGGPSFDLWLFLPGNVPETDIRQALTGDTHISRWDVDARRRCGGDGRPSFLDSLDDYPYLLATTGQPHVVVGVGFSYIHRDESILSDLVVHTPSWHLQHACGTDALNPNDLGDTQRLIALYDLLILIARNVAANKVPIAAAMIRGEAWAWPSVKDWNDTILVHKQVANVTNWTTKVVDKDWVSISLR